MIQAISFKIFLYKLVIEHFSVTEDKNKRGNKIRDRNEATKSIKMKSTANNVAETTVGVITNSTLKNEAIPSNDEKSGK